MVQMGLEVRNEVERRVWEPKKSNLNVGKVRRGLRIEWRRISQVTRKKMGRTEERLRVWLEHWWRRGTEGGAGGNRREQEAPQRARTSGHSGARRKRDGPTRRYVSMWAHLVPEIRRTQANVWTAEGRV